MAADIVKFVFFVIDGAFGLLVLAIVLNAILSWLVAFDVVNLRNQFVNSFAHFLDAVTRPVLRPFQRFIPPLGGVDITPIVALLVITGIRTFLIGYSAYDPRGLYRLFLTIAG